EYIDWILSDEGQCIIKEKGYAPVRPVSCSDEASEDAGMDDAAEETAPADEPETE
ncbi:MAG: hypothetical protein HKN17_07255, partial [Rhodothermales bacterium]|nr:hypothetical protein [Rhodothermales bacterium]